MDEKTIVQILEDQKEELGKYHERRFVARDEEELFEWDSEMAQVVTGVRRCGKSTICHLALRHRGIRYAYVDFNDDRLMGLKTEELNTLLKCILIVYGTDTQYIFLDELQDVGGWHLFVNRLLRQGFHIVLTGSNAKLLSGELATYITGRYNKIDLYPFSFRELCQLKGVDTKSLSTKAEAGRKALADEYLRNGGMPEMVRFATDRARQNYVEGLIETIVTKDIVRRFRIHNVESLRRLTHHLIDNVSQILNYKALTQMLNIASIATVQKYVSCLEQAYIVHRVRKYSFKSRERVRDEKIYVIDNGFIANRESVLLGENSGWRLENMVFIELRRRHQSMAEDIYYYKAGPRDKEVDFVVCRQSKVTELVQVAYTTSSPKTFNRETTALINAATILGCEKLTLVSFDESRSVVIGSHRIEVVNAAEWFLQLEEERGKLNYE